MKYIIRSRASNKIRQFYKNVAKKYNNTYSSNLMIQNIDAALNSIYQIENGIPRRNPTISRWRGLYMATTKDRKWNFAYRIEGDTIYVEDASHSQNMHESKKTIRLTETEFINLIQESLTKVLKEEFDYNKTSYNANPKKRGSLNDWELCNIITGIVLKMVSDKQISKEDGEMLMHYSLYNNDCYEGSTPISHK